MEKEKALRLALAVFRVTDLFYEELLAQKIRESAVEIAALSDMKECSDKIRMILVYFEIAREQGWVEDINFDVLSTEYKKLLENDAPQKMEKDSGEEKKKSEKKDTSLLKNEKKEPVDIVEQSSDGLSDRQKEIFDYFKKNKVEKAQVSDVMKLFSKVTRRTLSNDLAVLTQKGLIKKRNGGRYTEYFI